MRRTEVQSLSIDRPTVALLALLADRETDGNRSLVAWRAVREYAAKRGVQVDSQPAEQPAQPVEVTA